MHAHYFQHVPFEGLDAIEPCLLKRGFTITRTAFFDGESPPAPESIDFLVVMGGPMSVNEESVYPWLAVEKEFLRTFLATGKPVLGICLGAQLIASALGARVYRNTEPEIGWFPSSPEQVRPPDQDAILGGSVVVDGEGQGACFAAGGSKEGVGRHRGRSGMIAQGC